MPRHLPQKNAHRIAPCLYQIEDYKERLWNVAEERFTEHGWALLLGWPALDTEGRGESGGGRRVILTKELVAYLESMRMTPRNVKLPTCEDVVCSLRRKLGMSCRADRKKWWAQVECELSSPSPQFAAVHNVSTTTVIKQRKKRGIAPCNKRWTEEDSSRLLRLVAEGYDTAALAEALAPYRGGGQIATPNSFRRHGTTLHRTAPLLDRGGKKEARRDGSCRIHMPRNRRRTRPYKKIRH